MTTENIDPPIEIVTTPEHAAALAELKHTTDRIRYAAQHAPALRTKVVQDWLAAYGFEIRRSYVSSTLSVWRQVRGLDDTGEHAALTDEMLADLDAAADETEPVQDTDPGTVQNAEPIEPPAALDEPEPIEAREPVSPESRKPVTPVMEPERPAVLDAPAATPEPVQHAPESRNPVTPEQGQPSRKARGTGPFYLVALVASFISLDTAARYFGEILHITGALTVDVPLWSGRVWHIVNAPVERWALCGIVELSLVACGYAMRSNVRRPGGKPGPAQLVAVALVAFSALMAITIGGPVAGVARAVLGPVLALVALHLALGIEVHIRPGGEGTGTWARLRRELRERLLSIFGLGDDERDARARTRDRAVDRAARLATANYVIARKPRLARAVRQSGVALDPAARTRLKVQVAAQKNLDDLLNLTGDSPWR